MNKPSQEPVQFARPPQTLLSILVKTQPGALKPALGRSWMIFGVWPEWVLFHWLTAIKTSSNEFQM
jgi:hypothetical protein